MLRHDNGNMLKERLEHPLIQTQSHKCERVQSNKSHHSQIDFYFENGES